MESKIPSQTKQGRNQSRHQSRFVSVQAIYQGILTNFTVSLVEFQKINHVENIDQSFLNILYHGAYENIDELHYILRNTLTRKDFNNLDPLLQAILYNAAFEILFQHLDKGVAIKEYVTITQRFFIHNEYKMVHGVLDSLKSIKHIAANQVEDNTNLDTTTTEL